MLISTWWCRLPVTRSELIKAWANTSSCSSIIIPVPTNYRLSACTLACLPFLQKSCFTGGSQGLQLASRHPYTSFFNAASLLGSWCPLAFLHPWWLLIVPKIKVRRFKTFPIFPFMLSHFLHWQTSFLVLQAGFIYLTIHLPLDGKRKFWCKLYNRQQWKNIIQK